MYLVADHDMEHFGVYWAVYWKREEVHRCFANGKIEGLVLHNTMKKEFNLPLFKYKKYTGYWEIALFGELPRKIQMVTGQN